MESLIFPDRPLVRCRHQAFSDFGVLFPGYRKGAGYLQDAHELTSAFLSNTLQDYLVTQKHRTVDKLVVDNPDDKKRKAIRANPRDIIVHIY